MSAPLEARLRTFLESGPYAVVGSSSDTEKDVKKVCALGIG